MTSENAPSANLNSTKAAWALIVIVLVAIAVRLVFSLGISRGLLDIQPELEMTDGYHLIAQNLLEGHGYRLRPNGPPATERAPAYPSFLLAVFSVAGVNYIWVQVAQAMLGGLCCWLLYLFGRWVFSAELGLASAALFAIYPNSIQYSAHLYAENIYYPVFIVFAFFLCKASYKGSFRYGLAAGTAWGVSILTRGTLLPLPLVLPIGIALSRIHRSPPSRWIRWTIPAILAGIVVVAPWTARNYVLTDTFVPVSTWGWPPMYHGTQVAKRMGEWVDLVDVDIEATMHVREIFRQQLKTDSNSTLQKHYAVRYNELAKELTLADWKSDPQGMVKRSIAGVGYSWFFAFGAKTRALSLAIHLPLFIMFVVGSIYMARKYHEAFARAWPALGLVLFVNAFYAVAYPHVRYMSPAITLSFVFSGLSLILLGRRLLTYLRH